MVAKEPPPHARPCLFLVCNFVDQIRKLPHAEHSMLILRRSNSGPSMSLEGQNLRLPHRNTDGRFSPMNGHKTATAPFQLLPPVNDLARRAHADRLSVLNRVGKIARR